MSAWTDEAMRPLPEPAGFGLDMHGNIVGFASLAQRAAGMSPGCRTALYTEDQLREYARAALKAHLASADQPVAWRYKPNAGGTIWTYVEDGPGVRKSIDWCEAVEPLYTRPAAALASEARDAAPEIRLNDDGTLDEVVCTGGNFHLEQMDTNHWWLCVGDGKREVHVWLHARGKITANYEDHGRAIKAGGAAMGTQASEQPTGDGASAAAQTAIPPASTVTLWLWKNFVDGRPEYWAFDNPFPVYLDCYDPQTLGEPCGYALLKPSRRGRTDVSDDEVLRRIKAARGEHDALVRFYGVSTLDELVAAMERHIEKLQAKVAALTPPFSFAPNITRGA